MAIIMENSRACSKLASVSRQALSGYLPARQRKSGNLCVIMLPTKFGTPAYPLPFSPFKRGGRFPMLFRLAVTCPHARLQSYYHWGTICIRRLTFCFENARVWATGYTTTVVRLLGLYIPVPPLSWPWLRAVSGPFGPSFSLRAPLCPISPTCVSQLASNPPQGSSAHPPPI